MPRESYRCTRHNRDGQVSVRVKLHNQGVRQRDGRANGSTGRAGLSSCADEVASLIRRALKHIGKQWHMRIERRPNDSEFLYTLWRLDKDHVGARGVELVTTTDGLV